jgi:hypothetical protein
VAKLFKINKYKQKQTEKYYQARWCLLSPAAARSSTSKALLTQEYIEQYMY